MAPYKIILAEDHVLLRQGIKKIILEKKELRVVGETNDGLELLELLEKAIPDMIIVDLSMPRLRGLEVIKIIKGLYPGIKILVLTMHKNKESLYQAMENGADGYLLKEDADLAFHSAIETIRQGKNYISSLLFE